MGLSAAPNDDVHVYPAATAKAAAAVACGLLAMTGVAGCLSPEAAEADADKSAYDIIAEKQRAALGYEEAFTISDLEDQLRRKLMLDQGLPAAGEAAYGRAYLNPVPKQPEGVSEGLPLPENADVVPHRALRLAGVGDPVFSADLALADIGKYPRPTNEAEIPAPPADERIMIDPADAPVPPPPLVLTLVDALRIGAANSRDYQSRKESVYLTALDLDLERDRFEFRFAATLDADVAADLEGTDQAGLVVSPGIGVSKLFKTGAAISSRIGVDLAKLLTGNQGESLGLFADASVTIPLLQGAGVEVVTEPLQQAERDAVYAIWDFERFKRQFAVSVASDFYDVLVSRDAIANAAAALERRTLNLRRSQLNNEVGKESGISLDRVRSSQLSAEARLIRAEQTFESRLDRFKVSLGLPPDARVVLSDDSLEALNEEADRILGVLDDPERDGPPVEDLVEPTTAPPVDQSPDAVPAPAAASDPSATSQPAVVDEVLPSEGPIVDGTTQPAIEDDDLAPSGGATTRPAAAATRSAEAEGQPTVLEGDVAVDPATLADTDEVDAELSPLVDAATQPSTRAADDPSTDGELVARSQAEVAAKLDVFDSYAAEQRQLAEAAIRLAIRRRLDLAITYGQVADAQRKTVVAADGLEAILDLTGSASYGSGRGALSGGSDDARLDFSEGIYGLGLRLDLPIERTAERNAYRRSLIALDRAVRDAQAAEDGVKLDVLDGLRSLRTAEQQVRIQYEAIRVAERRVEAASLLVSLGRGDTRDITDAEDDLTEAQDNFTEALVDYRVSELELQRDLGVLQVTPDGLYEEVDLFGSQTPTSADAATQPRALPGTRPVEEPDPAPTP